MLLRPLARQTTQLLRRRATSLDAATIGSEPLR